MEQERMQPDPSVGRAFLKEITKGWNGLPEPAMVELRCLFPGRTPLVSRYSPDDTGFDMLLADAEGMNKHGVNTYIVVNPVRKSAPLFRRDANGKDKQSGAQDDDIIAAFFFWADGDDEEAANSIRNFAGPKYTMAVTTGLIPSPRPHIYWRIQDGPTFDLETWTVIQKGIAAVLSTDRTVVNPARIMRLPGFINWPTEQKKAKGRVAELSTFRTTYDDPREPVPMEQMHRAFAGAAPQPKTTQTTGAFQIDTGAQYAPLDRERLAIQALQGVEWHNAVIRLVGSYVAKGLSDGEIHALTDPLTLSGYTVEQTRREVQTAIDGARRKGWTPEPQYASPEALQTAPDTSFDAPPKQLPPLEWFDDVEPAITDAYIVKGVLSQGAMSVVYGPSNSGKTFFALDLAFHIAIGAPWRGRRVKQAAVLYLAAEGGRGVTNRIAALKRETGVCDVPLALRRAGLDLLHNQANLQELVDLSKAVTENFPELPLLIVIDTLSRIMAGGDENSAADMTALIRNIDAIREATGAHIMLVHHTGKDTARGARGHSSLRAATDTEIEVGNDNGARAALVTKQRDYQGGETFAFSLKSVTLGHDQDGDEVTSCVVEAQDSDEYQASVAQRKGLGGNQKILADTFDQMVAEGMARPNPGGVGMPEVGRFWCVPMDEFRTHAMGKMAASNKRGAFIEAWKALSDGRGMFCAASEMVWRTDRKVNK